MTTLLTTPELYKSQNANGMRRVDAATVPGQIARPDCERTILAR
jgi:hypothetical protein